MKASDTIVKAMRRALCIITAAALLTSCKSAEPVERPELLDAVNASVDIAIAQKMDLTDVGFYNGIIIPASEELSFEYDGYLNGLYVEAGAMVEEGDVIASLVGKNYSAISRLEDEIESLEERNAENFKYLEAELELERLAGNDTEELAIKLRHEKEMAELKLDEKRSRLETMKADDIGYAYIKAPRDCRVMSVTSTRTNGFLAAGTPVCALVGDGELMVTCDFISEKTIKNCSEFYTIIGGERYDVEYVPYTKAELKVMSTNEITPLSRFRFLTDPIGLEAGEYAAVMTVQGVAKDVLVIPVNSIYYDSAGKYVYKVENNVRTKTPVTTGISNASYIEVLDGLKEGDGVYVKN